jgi:hypothetical protein
VDYRLPAVTSAGPLQFFILLVASWIGRRQSEAIEYLRAENSVLRARLGHKRLRFTDAERRWLAQKGPGRGTSSPQRRRGPFSGPSRNIDRRRS